VSAVARIYSLASRVAIWTREEDASTQAAFELIDQLCHRCTCLHEQLPTPNQIAEDPDLDVPPLDAQEWVKLFRFFKRPVSWRGWVIQ